MAMPVMGVRYVWMIVHERRVPMRMRVGFGGGHVWSVVVLMMLVVEVQMIVLDRFMLVEMGMALAQ